MEKEKDTIILLKEIQTMIQKYGEIAIKKDYVLEVQDIYYLQSIKNSIDFMLKRF